ncbi:MAG: DNA polymerase, partial [Nanoarchaeota archaeon]|nr:DNA polymerase [Nanoarchaeota archaeon]
FCKKKKGFIPSIIEELITRRMRIKEMSRKKKASIFLHAREQSLKLMANSFYGYLGFFAARWYSLECAKSVTSWGRYYIHKVIDKAKEAGFKVLYSDTDSVFLLVGNNKEKDVKKFAESVNVELPGLMELEYEGSYPAGIFVSAKETGYGAKKKYALLSENGNIKIRGFESVRRNWSIVAKEVQEKVLNIILKENNKEKAFNYVKKTIDDLRNHKIELDKVIIRTQLQKEISDYDSIGPHVAVAKRLRDRGLKISAGTVMKYVITKGKGLIRERAKLPDEVKQNDYDPVYYVNNQIIPAVATIFSVLGYHKSDLSEKKGQEKLGKFF